MKISYGVSNAGVPVRIKHTRMFKQPVLKKDYAIRKECVLCHDPFWVWPDSHDNLCAICRYENLNHLELKELLK